ncbi:MAG: hypothetical protein RR533_09850, partial [Carnobacterium sp.]
RNEELADVFPYKEGDISSKFINYQCVSGSEEIVSTQIICDAQGNRLIKHSTKNEAVNDDHFWNLAIKTDPGYTAEDLTVQEIIEVKDDEVREAMINAIRNNPNLELNEARTAGNKIVLKY